MGLEPRCGGGGARSARFALSLTGLLAAVPLATLAGARRTASAYDRFRTRHGLATSRCRSIVSELLGRFRDVFALDEVEVGAEAGLFPAFSRLEQDFDLGIVASRGDTYGVQLDRPRLLREGCPGPAGPTRCS